MIAAHVHFGELPPRVVKFNHTLPRVGELLFLDGSTVAYLVTQVSYTIRDPKPDEPSECFISHEFPHVHTRKA